MSRFELGGFELDTPLINAAGSINGTSPEAMAKEVSLLARSAIGAITIGSLTVPPQPGNEALHGGPTYFYDEKAGRTYNSMGLPNIGLDDATRFMPDFLARARDGGKPLIVSVSPTRASPEIGDPFEQVVRLVYEMQLGGVDLIEVNTSCPNIVTEDGGRKPMLGYDLEGMYQLVETLKPWVGTLNSRLGVKLPPYITDEEKRMVPELAQLFIEQKVFGFIVTSNTIPGHIPKKRGKNLFKVPGGAAGLSGPAAKEIGRQQLAMWREHMGPNFEIVSALGLDSGEELFIRRHMGATAAGGVTFLWKERNWGNAVSKMVDEWYGAEYL